MIANLVGEAKNIDTFDFSENEFGDEGLCILIEAFEKQNTKIKTLKLGRNFQGKKEQRTALLDALSNLASSTQSGVTTLVMDGGPKTELKTDIIAFLCTLENNSMLTSLDISGHQMGDKGAIALAKSLQTNRKLTHLFYRRKLNYFIRIYCIEISFT